MQQKKIFIYFYYFSENFLFQKKLKLAVLMIQIL